MKGRRWKDKAVNTEDRREKIRETESKSKGHKFKEERRGRLESGK